MELQLPKYNDRFSLSMPSSGCESDKILKNGIWLYFFLLIFEGALRKWILPGLAAPLLIVRDPIALWILVRAFRYGMFRSNLYVLASLFLTFIAFYAALLVGHGNAWVALYGFRIMALHFPIIFVIGRAWNFDDVIRLGKILLWIHIGMTLLVAIQFYSPQSAWVNRGVGGDEAGSGFGATRDFFRVPGTFSFANGLAFFYAMSGAFILYFWLDAKARISKALLIFATIAMLVAIPLSVSRTVFFQFILTSLFGILTLLRKPKQLLRLGSVFIVGIASFSLLSTFSFFQTAVSAFNERFENASASEGGVQGTLIERFLGGMFKVLANSFNGDFLGKGLGLGTNVAAQLMTGERGFLLAEGEWGRVVGETGVLLGVLIICIRCTFAVKYGVKAWIYIKRNNVLPWLLCSFSAIIIIQGVWAQPTTLGFAILSGGLLLASFNKSKMD